MSSNPVREALLHARMQAASPFERWCIPRRIQPMPVAPTHVAAFVKDSHPTLPIEKIWEAVQEVSQSHLANGFADPTAGGIVAQVINEIASIDPPRCWKKSDHDLFHQMAYPLQRRVVDRENRRDLEVRRLQTELATTRQQLTALKHIVRGKSDHVTTEIKTSPDASA